MVTVEVPQKLPK